MVYLASSFSLQMIPDGADLRVRPITIGEVKGFFDSGCVSAIGHQGTADRLSEMLTRPVKVNRQSITLAAGDVLIVAQPVGNRIKYGEELTSPELAFFKVVVYGA